MTSNNKDKLNKKNKHELENKENVGKYNSICSIMEDYYNIILLGEYSEADVVKMLHQDNLIEELAILYIDDVRTLELQEEILREYLQKKPFDIIRHQSTNFD